MASWHQKRAFESLQRAGLTEKMNLLKEEGRHQGIQAMIHAFKLENPVVPKDLAYLEGDLFTDYIADIKLAQQFAQDNRKLIAQIIAMHMKSMQEIVDQIGETLEIQKRVIPVYNFKASDKWVR